MLSLSDITMKVVLTISKPNCFNHLHQVKKKLLLQGGKIEDVLENMKSRDIQQMGLSVMESAATLNLLAHIPGEAVAMLERCAARFGMWRGCFTHASLASEAWRVGYAPDAEDPGWRRDLTNRTGTLVLMANRITSDFESAPTGMRKTAGPDKVGDLQKICRVHEILKDKLKAEIPEDNFDTEWNTLHNVFMMGALDDYYKEAAVNQPVPWDVSEIPDIRSVLERQKQALDQHALAKQQELRRVVAKATFDSLTNDVLSDVKKLEVYTKDRINIETTWSARVQSHRRARRNKGKEAVQNYMDTRMRVASIETVTMTVEYNSFLAAQQKEPELSVYDGKQ